MKKLIASLLVALPMVGVSGAALAAGGNVHLDKAPIKLGNERSLQRGAKYFMNHCMGCHGLKYLRFSRMASDLGLTEEEVSENLLFTERKMAETMTIATSEEASAAWFGKVPPDLTLTARAKGSDWVYTYLRTFYSDPSTTFGVNNVVLENASMPHVLEAFDGVWEKLPHSEGHGDGHGDSHGEEHAGVTRKAAGETFRQIKAGSMEPHEYDRMVTDLTAFLTYAAEPIRMKREAMGVKVMLFLFLFFILAYFLKKEYWKDIH